MKASHFLIRTLKEAPSEAETASHKLMVRAGMIRRVASGIYSYLPLALRSIRKIEAIIREEMHAAGALELALPSVQPAELWKKSQRWSKYGPELLRFKDRHDRDFVIGPTHEEVVTDLARQLIQSYRHLPCNWYQIQTKFRDEIRPRFGVMRGREFLMKDAYSFDRDASSLAHTYEKMVHAYERIFSRLGLVFRRVQADNGSIGGCASQEFHVITSAGEDALAYCPQSEYAANMEVAEALPPSDERPAPREALTRVDTPNTPTCVEVAAFLQLPITQIVKSIVLAAQKEGEAPYPVLVLLRADHTFNEIKAQKLIGDPLRFATEAEIRQWFNAPAGYLGPLFSSTDTDNSPPASMKIMADWTVLQMGNFVIGANAPQAHYKGVNWERDLPLPIGADLRNVCEGDRSPDGQGNLALCRGIEVGHVFQIGTSYSQTLGATWLDETGRAQPISMGCYGIGVSRILGAAIEQNHDAKGIIWPEALAPFEVVLCPLAYSRNARVREVSERLYEALTQAGVDVILDDREERFGAMLADWELIGIPHRVVIGERNLDAGCIEYQGRRDTESTLIPLENAADIVASKIVKTAF